MSWLLTNLGDLGLGLGLGLILILSHCVNREPRGEARGRTGRITRVERKGSSREQ